MKMIQLRQWRIDSVGMNPKPSHDYTIEKERLGECRGNLSDWLLHVVGEKQWTDAEDFILAWQVAVHMHRVDVSHLDIPASIAAARRLRAQNLRLRH